VTPRGADEPTATAGSRREARERILGLLYEAETRDLDPIEVVDALPVRPDPYVVEVLVGVSRDRERIDEEIRRHAVGWSLERMPALDRAVLRMAIHELIDRLDVPTAVVISEAVELAAIYSTDRSSRFVNGVLAAVAAKVRSSGGAPG
jgi:N utilization substance protein B